MGPDVNDPFGGDLVGREGLDHVDPMAADG